ncbi:diguanylate cyclase [Enterovirga sp. DB1703]|uniref:diguanylate cyclase n=2 Tax=Enterovirga aerilata TaxID=2730920 RepID=A0A849I8F1_9HYPH|nr:diguanylate cyclase [Enterovirga sp. DB1703]
MQGKSRFSLYATEEAVLEKSDVMLSRLAEVAGGVQDLAEAYRRSYREQRQLVRMSDRMQSDLQNAVQRLAEQARELQELNEKLSEEIQHRAALEAELRRIAETDVLTGALSRRRFIELAQSEWARQKETGSAACLLMLDLDRFKRINDLHGHAAGDRALESFGAACRAELRSLDLMGRLGGEEFAIILPDTRVEAGREMAEKLRAAIAAISFRTDKGAVSLSVSIGAAQGEPGEALEDTMCRADRALYRAKSAGRDRVQIFTPELLEREVAA